MDARRLSGALVGIVGLCVVLATIFAGRPDDPGAAAASPAAPSGAAAVAPTAPLATRPDPAAERTAAVATPDPPPSEPDPAWELSVEVLGLWPDPLDPRGRATVRLTAHPRGDEASPLDSTSLSRGLMGARILTVHDAARTARFRSPAGVERVRVHVSAAGFEPFVAEVEAPTARLTVRLTPIPPVVVDFPGLAPAADRLRLAVDFGAQRAGRRGWRYRSLDRFGRVELVDVPLAGTVALRVETSSEADGEPLTLLSGALEVTADRRHFRFPDVVAHRVELVGPIPGEPFELRFELRQPTGLELPRLPGWSGGYGLFGELELVSDDAGRLTVALLEGTADEGLLGSATLGEVELEPFEVTGPGRIVLTPIE